MLNQYILQIEEVVNKDKLARKESVFLPTQNDKKLKALSIYERIIEKLYSLQILQRLILKTKDFKFLLQIHIIKTILSLNFNFVHFD